MKILNAGIAVLFGGMMAGTALVACGGSGAGQGSGCTVDKDCKSNELCHPLAKFCVKTCTTATDCPASESSCTTLTANGTTTASFCQCTGDAACNPASGTATSVCGNEDRVCENLCKSDSDCSNSGRTCNTTTGQCVTKGSSSSTCNSGNETLGSAGGPDVCAYGTTCASNTCTAVATCTEPKASGAPSWSPSTQTVAPVITSVTATYQATSDTATQCADGGPAGLITVTYYSSTGFTQKTHFADWKNNVSVNANGSAFTGTDFGVTSPQPGAKFGTATFGTCSTQRSAAVYIKDDAGNVSNTVCVTW